MASARYIPGRGDIVWLDFDPQVGSEIMKRRPALVLSPKNYNAKVGLFIICPITSSIKGYPFEVLVKNKHISGAVLSDQVKSMDWRVRKSDLICRSSRKVIEEVLQKLEVLIDD